MPARTGSLAPQVRLRVNGHDDVIGLIPAAGRAARMGRSPGSKEVFPIGFMREAGGAVRPRVACEYLLASLREAGVRKAYVVLRAGKWDIPAYLRDGRDFGLDLAYLIMRHPYGPPYTLDQAYPFVSESTVALGFPDILLAPPNAFSLALARLRGSAADAVLGLFPARDARSCDMVELDGDGRVQRLEVKPQRTDLRLTWGLAVWTPRFSAFLHQCVRSLLGGEEGATGPPERELHAGEVFQRAAAAGLAIEGVEVSAQPFIDIGTPEALREAWRRAAALDATE